MQIAIIFSIILTGFTAMVSQIVFMRELLIVFYGNELSIAFILASWLIGGAIGASLLGGLADKIKAKISVFSLCQLALAVAIPSNILAIRSIKAALKMNPGEIMPFFPMAISSFVILAPVCVVLGFAFSLACRIHKEGEGAGAVNIGTVYVLESVGAMAGGLAASFVLIRLFGSFQIAAILGILLSIAAAWLVYSSRGAKARAVLLAACMAIALVALGTWSCNGLHALDGRSLARQWRGYELIASKNSIYGNIAVARNASQYSFFDNGLHLYTVPDKQTAEEAVHFALLEHPDPKTVLLIGGGVGGLH